MWYPVELYVMELDGEGCTYSLKQLPLDNLDEKAKQALDRMIREGKNVVMVGSKVYMLKPKPEWAEFINAMLALDAEEKRYLSRVDYSKVSKKELVRVLYDVLYETCAEDDGRADSRAISAYADGLRLLARLGLFEIEDEAGRRVIGRFLGW